jgi:hypothetical protein
MWRGIRWVREVPMRFMTIYKTAKADADRPPTEDEITAMGKFISELADAGVLLATDGLQSRAHGARVRLENGKVTVIDGPFSESKEVIGGFAIVQVGSKEEAIALTERFLRVAGDGECEVRLMHDEPAYVAPGR